MLSFITENVYQPWSNADVIRYEKEGSQRDSVLYNSHYDARIMLSEENVYQCSIRVNHSKYKNFYLIAVRRNLFFLTMYVPQIGIVKDFKDNVFIRKCIERLPTIRKIIENSKNDVNIEDEIQFSDENCVVVKVNASISEFLFPRRGYITNDEIKNKYAVLNSIYSKCVNEFECIGNMLENYSRQLRAQIDDREKKVKNMLVKKGVRIMASTGLAFLTGIYVDLDTIFGFNDLVDVSDVIDISSSSFETIESIEYVDWDTGEDLLLSENDLEINEEQYNVSFGAQKETLQRSGGGLGSIKVTITKEPGSSNLFCITDGTTTIHNVVGGTPFIKIDGIKYLLPKLKG